MLSNYRNSPIASGLWDRVATADEQAHAAAENQFATTQARVADAARRHVPGGTKGYQFDTNASGGEAARRYGRHANRMAQRAGMLEAAQNNDRLMDLAENSLALKHGTERYKSDNTLAASNAASNAMKFPGFNTSGLLQGLNAPSVSMYDANGNLIGGSRYGS